MEWFLAALLVIIVGLCISLLVAFASGRDWLRRKTKHQVVVHTKDGDSLDGVLFDKDDRGLVLGQAVHLESKTPVGGLVWVPAENVRWLQVDPPRGNDD